MSALAGVLFDMDGTLLDSEKLWDVGVYELAEHLGGTMTVEIRHALIGASGPNALRIIFEALELQPYESALADAGRWLEKRVTELFENGIPWRPGAEDALALVRDSGLRTALVTNTVRSLTEYGLDTIGREYFDVTVCGDEVYNGKPAPDPYLRAARLLGLDPSVCLAIEDSATGSQSAAAAGCSVLVVPCEIPVPDGPGRVFRDSLVGLRLADLHAALG